MLAPPPPPLKKKDEKVVTKLRAVFLNFKIKPKDPTKDNGAPSLCH